MEAAARVSSVPGPGSGLSAEEAPHVAGWTAARSTATPGSSPLSSRPGLSRSVLRRLRRRQHQDAGLIDTARTLWELERGADWPEHLGCPSSSLTKEEMAHLRGMVRQLGRPPDSMSPRGAFSALQGSSDYTGERCDLAPMDIDSLSIPDCGFKARPLEELMGQEGADFVAEFIKSCVLPEQQQRDGLQKLNLRRPYSDPRLRDVAKRGALLRRMLDAGLLEVGTEDGVRVGIFTVWKSDGTKQRVIVDARLSNACFSLPDSPDLPTGGSYAQIQMDSSHTLWGSTCDLKDDFLYNAASP